MGPQQLMLGSLAVPTHDLFVALAVLVTAAMVLWESRRRGRADRTMVVISAGALFGAGVGARLGTVVRYLAEADHPTWTGVLLDSGKTVVGGLAGAYIGVLVTKRLIGYREPTGDVFAAAAALGIAVGRLGCLLTEPPGTPTSMPWAVNWNGEQRHPSFLYEIGFLLVLFVVLLALRRPLAGHPGELFTVFLVGYGTFRFAVEFVRGNDVWALGLTRPQWFLLLATPFVVRHAWRAWHPRPQSTSTTASVAVPPEVLHEPATP